MIRIAIIIAIAFILSGAILPSELPTKEPQARSPQELCFTAYQWYEDNGGEWDTPWRNNTLGMIDLRTLPQQGTPGPRPEGRGLFILDTAGLCAASGMPLSPALDTILGPLESLLLEEQLSLPAGSMALLTIEQAIWNIFTVHSDPSGQTAIKPLRGTIDSPVSLSLPGYGVIRSEPFSGNHINNRVNVFQADYRRNRANVDRGALSLNVVRRWTGAEMLKVYGEMSDTRALELVPDEYRNGDGSDLWRNPDTTIIDNFNRANESLDASNWREIIANWSVINNRVVRATNPANHPAVANHTTELSCDDHYAQVDYVGDGGSTTQFMGPTLRQTANNERTFYGGIVRESGGLRAIAKVVSGVITTLESDSGGGAPPQTIKLEIDGSTLNLYDDGMLALTALSETSITGNLLVGIWAHGNQTPNPEGDNFEAADPSCAVATATPQRIIIVKEINKIDQIAEGVKMLISGEIERFMNIQKILQEHSIKMFIDNTPLTPGEQIAHYELTPSYFNLGRRYGLKDNELARAILRPAFVGGL